jgi:hypothetical protein
MTDEPDPKPAPPSEVRWEHDPGWSGNIVLPDVPGDVEYDVDYPTTLETEKVLENRADDQP